MGRDGQFPFANYDDLRQAGLLGLCVPRADGRMGADYATYMMVAAEIVCCCGATARKVEGGWRVNGRKIFASLSGAADY